MTGIRSAESGSRWFGYRADAELSVDLDPSSAGVFMPHPLYASSGWISVINPADTADRLIALLRQAHDAARARVERRSSV
jgi:hypothetical protein